MEYPTYLIHYGIPGQKWGTRRWQNEDGSLTPEGYEHYGIKNRVRNAAKTKADVDDIISTFNNKDRKKLGLKSKKEEYLTIEQGEYVLKRSLQKHGNVPVAFFDMLDDGDSINVALGTRSGKEYRGKGYATKAVKRGMQWYEKNASKFGNKPVVWGVRTDNEASIKLAKKHGFIEDPNSLSNDKKWINYVKKYK